MDITWDQYVSLAGAFFILLAYGTESLKPGRMSQTMYQFLNTLGASLLCFTAVLNRQYGFIVLEGAWALIGVISLIRIVLGKA